MANKAFTDQMGYNIKVYVDNIVVKHKKVKDHTKDLNEVFGVLRRYRIKQA